MARTMRLAALAAAATLVVPAVAAAGELTLHPSGFGEKTYAAWKAHEGQPDSNGNANQALYLQKGVPTAQFVSANAVVRGVAGEPLSFLTGLSWEHRNDSHCGAGAPRWNVFVRDPNGDPRTIFLGCAASAHTPGSQPGWTRDSYPGPAIDAQAQAQTGFPASDLTLRGLVINFDEGNDLAFPCPNPGVNCVYLDNIIVNDHCWTGAQDNGSNAPTAADCTPAAFSPFALGFPTVAPTVDDGLLAELGDLFPEVAPTDWVFYPNIL